MKHTKKWLVTHSINAGDPLTGESFCCGADQKHVVEAKTKEEALSKAPKPTDKNCWGSDAKYIGPAYILDGYRILYMPDESCVALVYSTVVGWGLIELLNLARTVKENDVFSYRQLKRGTNA